MERINFLLNQFWNNHISESELRELEKLLDNDEEFQVALKKEFDAEIRELENTPNMGSLIQDRVSIVSNRIINIKLKWISVAAILLILLGVGQLMMTSKKEDNHNIVAIDKDRLEEISNTNNVSSKINLSDQSEVTLFANSSIKYSKKTFSHNRLLKLKGKGRFNVRADATHPFVVVANNISVTALGTEFIVGEEKGFLNVELLHGKLLVQIPESGHNRNRVYLEPGESIKINLQNNKIQRKNNGFVKTNITKQTISVVKREREKEDLKFINENLYTVFNKLSKRFNVKIICGKGSVDNVYFTGKVIATDNITTILTLITEMNDLSYKQEGDVFLIQKK